MKANELVVMLLVVGCGSASTSTPSPVVQPVPRDEARELATRIATAHGVKSALGFAAIRYEHELDFGERPVWRSVETVELALPYRAHQEWPLHSSALGWDGSMVWTKNWKLDNPPEMMPFLSYFGLTIPLWISGPETVLGPVGRARLPGNDTEYVTLTANPSRIAAMPPSAGYYRVFVDPATWQIRGVAYSVTYRPFLDAMGLPANVTEMGPMTHVIEATTSVDGVVLPSRYHTIGPNGARAGSHIVNGWKTVTTFDPALVAAPADAVRSWPPQ
ncbi:MAG: hypothetical protein ACKV2T_28925 [Kofleriaceae bacterium]